MATKKIVKFILKMIVAAAVVVGGYFLIKAIFSKGTNSTDIAKESADQGIVAKYEKSAEGMIDYSQNNTPQRTRIKVTNDITKFLMEYYDHYVTISVFQNKQNDSQKNEILKNISSLSDKIAITTNHLNRLKTTNTQDLEYEQEQSARLEIVANDYFEQTKQLFKLCELLKNYVFETNYSSKMLNVYEIQMEVVKDYAKYVFENEIYGKYNAPAGQLLASTNETSLNSVMQKFNSRQELNRNGDKEIKLFMRYQLIDKESLNAYFAHVDDKDQYIASVENDTTRFALIFLNDYLKADKF